MLVSKREVSVSSPREGGNRWILRWLQEKDLFLQSPKPFGLSYICDSLLLLKTFFFFSKVGGGSVSDYDLFLLIKIMPLISNGCQALVPFCGTPAWALSISPCSLM